MCYVTFGCEWCIGNYRVSIAEEDVMNKYKLLYLFNKSLFVYYKVFYEIFIITASKFEGKF